ncbi:hypothetical protein OIE68_04555 [Nocardia vinacea]|nr:hypothetical protein OIE68_04555 [Nocardia vinacea]
MTEPKANGGPMIRVDGTRRNVGGDGVRGRAVPLRRTKVVAPAAE